MDLDNEASNISKELISIYLSQVNENGFCMDSGHSDGHTDHHKNGSHHTNNPGTGWYHNHNQSGEPGDWDHRMWDD